MKAGDIVRVAYQPRNQCVQLVGEVGFIEEVKGEYASIETFDREGKMGGAGSVPLSCLVLEPSAVWHEAKAKLDAYMARLTEQYREHDRRWKAKVAEVAKAHGVSTKKAYKIYSELSSWAGR